MLDKHGYIYLRDTNPSSDLGIQNWTNGPPVADQGAPTSTIAAPGGTGGGSTSISPVTTTSPSPFVINIVWDPSVSSAPPAFTADVLSAVQYLESQFSDPVSINIGVGYGEIGGRSMDDAVGGSTSYLTSVSYSSLLAALNSDSTSPTDVSVLASLPATPPVDGTYRTTEAQAKALGLVTSGGTPVDGYVGFSSTLPFTYSNTNGVATGTYDFTNVVLHEMTEVMGRQILTGGTIGSTANSYDLLDMLHYSAPGVRDFSASTPGYFSVDGGVTNLGNFNTVPGGDTGDWASSATSDAFDAFAQTGTVNAISSADLAEMNAIGWDPAPASGPSSTAVSASSGTTSAGDMIAGGSGSEIISPSTLTGTLASGTPTFVLADADDINFTGTTGEVALNGGAGADFATGASGINDYDTNFTSDRINSAMDDITNFHPAVDMLDPGGVGTASNYTDTTSRPATHSVGWQVNGGNTFDVVNTAGRDA